MPVMSAHHMTPGSTGRRLTFARQSQRNVGIAKGVTVMVVKKNGIIIETPTETRQGEPGPSVLLLLVVSVSVAVVVMAIVWFVLFRT